MQKIIITILPLLIIILLSNCSHKLNPEGVYQQAGIVVDANLNEWNLPLRFGNKQGTIQYSVTNDRENIYIALLCKDEPTEQKILRMGMTVYFDPKGGDNKNISINYPMKSLGGPKAEDQNNRSTGIANANQRSRKQELMLQSPAFAITGFQHLENRAYEISEKHPIQLAMKITDENYLAYEAAVPIKNLLGRPLSVNDPMKNFSVGFIVKGLQGEGNTAATPVVRSGGRMGGRGGMGGGRSMGGGRNAATATGSGNRSALFKDDLNWYRFRLAYK